MRTSLDILFFQATAEQIRLAQMIYDQNDADFEDKVKQVRFLWYNFSYLTIKCSGVGLHFGPRAFFSGLDKLFSDGHKFNDKKVLLLHCKVCLQ